MWSLRGSRQYAINQPKLGISTKPTGSNNFKENIERRDKRTILWGGRREEEGTGTWGEEEKGKVKRIGEQGRKQKKKKPTCGMGNKGCVARSGRRCYNMKENIIQNSWSPIWLPHNSTGYAQTAFLEGRPSLPLRALLCEMIVPTTKPFPGKGHSFFFPPIGVKP